jgi:hypothetical protein
VVGREDHPEGRRSRVELRVAVRQRLGVTLVEADLEPGLLGRRARLLELVGRDVESGDLGSCPRRDQGNAAGAAGEVEEPLALLRRQRLDDPAVDGSERLRDPLVRRAAPGSGRLAQPDSSIARLVSSVRTFQSSG